MENVARWQTGGSSHHAARVPSTTGYALPCLRHALTCQNLPPPQRLQQDYVVAVFDGLPDGDGGIKAAHVMKGMGAEADLPAGDADGGGQRVRRIQRHGHLDLMEGNLHPQAKSPHTSSSRGSFCGKTGQLIFAWCAKAGFIPAKADPVQWIRARRKCCLETREQSDCAKRWMNQFRS